MRTPETTSSPCAFGRKSPEGVGSPVISSREKATPEHELSPLFPNTICCTFTAVPQSSGMWLMRRYSTARLPVQESNTAVIAWRSCSCGSCGNSSPVSSSKSSLKRSRELPQVVGVELHVLRHARVRLPLLDQVLVALARDAAADVPEHLREAPVRVPGEALVARRSARGPRRTRRSGQGSGPCRASPASTRARRFAPTRAAGRPAGRGCGRPAPRGASARRT